MNGQDVINALSNVLDIGDTLDNAGGGVKALTDGGHTTREVIKLQLGQFLLHIADGCPFINEGQAILLNLVFGNGHEGASPEQYMELAKSVNAPDPSNNLALIAFQLGDKAISENKGEKSTALTDMLINLHEAFGRLIILANESVTAQSRFDLAINLLKTEALFGGLTVSATTADNSTDQIASDGFVIEDGVLTKYEGQSKNIVVPDGVTRIDDAVFSGMHSIETIILPRSLETIGISAFRDCDNLKSINLPEGLTEIGFDAFTHCDGLVSIDIPSTVQSIGGDAFCFCDSIKGVKIPVTLTDIGEDAFMFCDDLEKAVVYGGIHSYRALTRIKKHFPDRVNVSWEDEEQNESNPGISFQRTSGELKKTSTSCL